MQPTERALLRPRDVVLHELAGQPRSLERRSTEGLDQPAAVVPVHVQDDLDDAGDLGGQDLHDDSCLPRAEEKIRDKAGGTSSREGTRGDVPRASPGDLVMKPVKFVVLGSAALASIGV